MANTSQDHVAAFRAECVRAGLAATHQRMAIYGALTACCDHPSPEDIYKRVRRVVPSISLGTVYKNIKTFIEHGLLREVSVHHGSTRLEVNLRTHHHLICLRCKAIIDLEDEAVEPVCLKRRPPSGFKVDRFSVQIVGLCRRCGPAGPAGIEPRRTTT